MNETAARTRGRGRPSRPVLTRQSIAQAAMELVRTSSHEALTMAALARNLGVSASALYNHVASKHEVFVLVQDEINGAIDCSAFGRQPWDEALSIWARSYREQFIEHTDLIAVVSILPVADAPQTLKMYERVSLGLADAGLPDEDVVDLIVGLEALIFGAAYDASVSTDLFDPGQSGSLAPTFARLSARRSQHTREAADEAFEKALAALLDGWKLRHR